MFRKIREHMVNITNLTVNDQQVERNGGIKHQVERQMHYVNKNSWIMIFNKSDESGCFIGQW